jgi:hypothetical protein
MRNRVRVGYANARSATRRNHDRFRHRGDPAKAMMYFGDAPRRNANVNGGSRPRGKCADNREKKYETQL